MKKYMVADLVKDITDSYLEERAIRIKEITDKFDINKEEASKIVDNYKDYDTQDLIAKAMDEYGLNLGDAEMFVNDHPNESTWADIEATAESLGVDITDIEDDDVENYLEMGGNKGKLESSIGPIQWIYDNKLKAYLIYMIISGTNVMYRLSPEMMKEWNKSDSMGEYYNLYIRGNDEIEDPEISCGCGPNPCEPEQVDRFNTRFVSIS